MNKQQEVDASEYESELIFLRRQIRELEKDLEDSLNEDLKAIIQGGLPKLRDRVAELEACPPTLAQTLEWLQRIEKRLTRLSHKAVFGDPETREMLAVVRKRIAEVEHSQGRQQHLEDETNAATQYARPALDIISDEMLLAEVERRGLQPRPRGGKRKPTSR